MDKGDAAHYTMECYSAIKRNAFESVLMRRMNLKPIIPSEMSQLFASGGQPPYHPAIPLLGIYPEKTKI